MGLLFKSKTKKREGVISDLDEILGYLDEIVKQRKYFDIIIKKKTFRCAAFQIDEKKKMVRIQDNDIGFYNKDSVKCGFNLDNTWFTFSSTLNIVNDKPYLLIPNNIIHTERRKHKRVSFAQRENAKASVLESLGSGIGVTGTILNLSLNGICIEIDRAVILESEKEVSPHPNLLKKNQKLGLVRIKGVSMIPNFDISGIVNEIRRGHKWKLAIELSKFSEDIKTGIEKFIESRSSNFRIVRRSRQKRLEAEKQKKEEAKEQSSTTIVDNKINIPGSTSIASLEAEIKEKEKKEPIDKKKTEINNKSKNLIQILIVGKPLDRDLFFLRKFINFDFLVANNIPDFLKTLSEHSPDLLFIPHIHLDQNIINILIKISEKVALKDIRIFLFLEKIISTEEIAKCKKLNIEGIIKLPIQDPSVLIKKIGKKG